MSSVELPMTDLTRAILRREYRQMRWTRLLLRAAILIGLPLFVAYMLTARGASPDPEVRTAAGNIVLGALGIAAVIVLFLTWSHARDERAVRLDLRSSHYLRTTGRLAVHYVGDDDAGRFDVHLDDQKMRSPWGRKEPPFTRAKGATVDHTRHARVVFAITDAEGWLIFLAPGYKVPPSNH